MAKRQTEIIEHNGTTYERAARKAYDEAEKAYDEARKAYDEAMKEAKR